MTAPHDLGRLRNHLADLVRLHPPLDWSPGLLMAVNCVLEMYVEELGMKPEKAAVLELVKR